MYCLRLVTNKVPLRDNKRLMCDMFILNPVQDEQGAVWSFCVLKAHSFPFVSIVNTDCWEIS